MPYANALAAYHKFDKMWINQTDIWWICFSFACIKAFQLNWYFSTFLLKHFGIIYKAIKLEFSKSLMTSRFVMSYKLLFIFTLMELFSFCEIDILLQQHSMRHKTNQINDLYLSIIIFQMNIYYRLSIELYDKFLHFSRRDNTQTRVVTRSGMHSIVKLIISIFVISMKHKHFVFLYGCVRVWLHIIL